MFLNKRKVSSANQKRNLIAYSNPDSIIAEQFRGVRANIRFITGNEKKIVLMITSPKDGEGKSTTAANLGVSMAQQKEKVLLIDANLREPFLHFIFKAPNAAGLTDILTGKSSFEDVVYHTEIGRLDVLTCGTIPHNPAELLGSEMMRELLAERSHEYDVILIDSPGVLEVADAKILAGRCNGVIMVMGEGKTELNEVIEAKKALAFAQANLIGLISNQVK